MQNRYTDPSPVKNRRPSPATPKKKLQQFSTASAVSPADNNNVLSPRRTPRRLPTSPQRVEMSSVMPKHLPMAPFESPQKRRQPPKAKNSSMFLVRPRAQDAESRPVSSTSNRSVYLWVVVLLSLVAISLMAQSRLTRNQEHVFFHDLPQRRASSADLSKTERDASVDNSAVHEKSMMSSQIETEPSQSAMQRILTDPTQDEFSFAIVSLLRGDADYTLDLYTIIASTYVQRQAGSKAQVIVYVTGVTELPAEHANLLQNFQIQTYFVETPDVDIDTSLRLDVFHRVMSDLVTYERVLYMKSNIMARGSMDYLYLASKSGVLQENLLFANRLSPASSDIFMVKATKDVALLDHSLFHPDNGWGHAFQSGEQYELINGRTGKQWDFVGADDTPGLLYHYARFERGRVSIVLQDAVHSMAVDEDEETTFESIVSLKDRNVMGLAEFYTCWREVMDHLPCRTPHNTYFYMDYKNRPEDLTSETTNKSPAHFWYSALDKVNAQYDLRLDPSALFREKDPAAHFAYAFVVGGCNPENDTSYKSFIWQVLINAYILKESKSVADVVLFVQMSFDSKYEKLPDEDSRLLDRMSVDVRYIEKYQDESFDSIIMDKFRVLQLTQYKKIIVCDSDVMLRGNLDYLFELSERGVLKSNVVFATELVPATGHIFMVSPLDGDWDHIMDISERSGQFWNEIEGWGHSFSDLDGYDLTSGVIGSKWDFPGANADQGLLYHWVKYEEQSASIFVGESVQNWGEHRHESTLMEALNLKDIVPTAEIPCWEDVMGGQPCKSPYNQYIHFSGVRKPWLQMPPKDLTEETSQKSALHYWFYTLAKLSSDLDMGIDFTNWRPKQVPFLGLSHPSVGNDTDTALNGATYDEPDDVVSPYTHDLQYEHRFAYAYVIGGVLPENPSYRNYFNDIMISTYNQREEGSKADVVVFVQMAYESQHDIIPSEDSRLLNAMNITVKYIPKAEDESFYRIMLDKFRVLGLTEYSRVIFMDGDVMAMGNLDYLFDLSVKGILKENVVFAGSTEPANGGFFMLAPKAGATDCIRKIIAEKEERGAKLPYPHWDNAVGWGHELEDGDYIQLLNERKKLTDAEAWNFYGSFADQGLLYHWVKYVEKSVSIVFRKSVQNWGSRDDGKVHLEETLPLDIFDGLSKERKCWQGMMKMKPCRAPHSDFIHFTGSRKPWLKGPPENYQTAIEESPAHYWFHILSILNTKMEIGLDFENWRKGHRPALGLYPLRADAAKTNYA